MNKSKKKTHHFIGAPEIPLQEIEELELHPQQKSLSRVSEFKGILLRSDRETINFGGHLEDSEMRYLHTLIKLILAS